MALWSWLPSTGAAPGPVDRQPPPPVQRDFHTADGSLRLSIRAVDPSWRVPTVRGRLDRLAAPGLPPATLWERTLPQAYGPRFALVGARGQVVLVDEWIHTPSAHALQLLDARGEVRQEWSFEALAKRLNITGRALSEAASAGPWVSRAPQLDTTGQRVLIGAGGRSLALDLASGRLDVLD